jgi:hypothetical protein
MVYHLVRAWGHGTVWHFVSISFLSVFSISFYGRDNALEEC